MDFALSSEQTMIVDTARRIGEQFGLDYWREKDAAKDFPREIWNAICDAGLCGIALPEFAGGAGLGMVEMALAVEALAAAGAGSTVAQLFMINPIFGGISLSRFASPLLRSATLPRLISGEINFCMALTEPDAGTNTLALRSFARADGDGWRLDGAKIWISAVPHAQKMLVVARTLPIEQVKRRTEGLSMFIIDVERAGLSHSTIEKVGTNTCPASNVFFSDVRIEPHELCGPLHNSWSALLDVLNTERIVTTAGLVGAGRLALRLAVAFANQRKVFGDRPISAYQGLQFPLAQALAEIEAARLFNLRAASQCDRGEAYGEAANMAKLLAAQAAARATDSAMQTLGGMGYSKEAHIERLWRDCRLFRMAPISEEMILNYLAVQTLGMMRGY